MDRNALTLALAEGNESGFARLLDRVPDEELAGPEGIALLEAAARAGRAEAVWSGSEASAGVQSVSPRGGTGCSAG
ncbi:hypothetical protein [Kitasatospora sp. NPDC051914]|uniref:hypothetical protein n=1 Tax=Kitasatospora sp. NPDC051914 TaxID=3154945 RepID=UPI00343F7AEC